MAGTRLLIARHGETVDNADGRWQGWGDSPLSSRGMAQAGALARRLQAEHLSAVYSSDLGRARHTARIATASRGLTIHELPALRERNVGLFSSLTGPEVEIRFPEAMARRRTDGVLDWAPPEGESFRQMLDRILPAIDQIAAAWAGRTVLIVTHGGVVRLLAAHAADGGWDGVYGRHPSNCGLSSFLWRPDAALDLLLFDESDYLNDDGVLPLAEDAAS